MMRKASCAAAALSITALALAPATALADGGSVQGDTAYKNTGDLATQTIVGEDDGNSVVVTNRLDSVNPTGVAVEYAPYAVLLLVVAGGAAILVRQRTRKGVARHDGKKN